MASAVATQIAISTYFLAGISLRAGYRGPLRPVDDLPSQILRPFLSSKILSLRPI